MSNIYQINGREYEWNDITIVLGGVKIEGFRKINYTRKREKEAMFAKGRKAHSIQSGNETITGSITFTQSQMEALEMATGGNILTAKVDIIVTYGSPVGAENALKSAMSTDVIKAAEFTEYQKGMSQGDKFMEIEMPFVALDIKTAEGALKQVNFKTI